MSIATRNPRPVSEMASPDDTLPPMNIDPFLERLRKLPTRFDIWCLDAPTGTGKTLKFAREMARSYRTRVLMPTITAVRGAFSFIRKHCPSLSVGYAAGRARNYQESDQLVYMTIDHFGYRLLSLIKRGKFLPRAGGEGERRPRVDSEEGKRLLGDLIIIDEAHVGTKGLSMVVGILRYLFQDGRPEYSGPKIVFTSATFNRADVAEHFPTIPVQRISIPRQEVKRAFLQESFDPLVGDVTEKIITYILLERAIWKKTKGIPPIGIVFRPGKKEVDVLLQILESTLSSYGDIILESAYSGIGDEQIDRIMKSNNESMKVIIGTNVLESSVTVENASFVIDDCLEKESRLNEFGRTRLVTRLISKSSALQRAGRVGRMRPGRVYTLLTQESWLSLPDFRTKELDRVPIHSLILSLLDAGLAPQDILRLNEDRYRANLKTLLFLGMIEGADISEPIPSKPRVRFQELPRVTEAGRFISALGISVQEASMVYRTLKLIYTFAEQDQEAYFPYARAVLGVACMIDAYDYYFYLPRRGKDEPVDDFQKRTREHKTRYFERFYGRTDIHTLTNLFLYLMHDLEGAMQQDRQNRVRTITMSGPPLGEPPKEERKKWVPKVVPAVSEKEKEEKEEKEEEKKEEKKEEKEERKEEKEETRILTDVVAEEKKVVVIPEQGTLAAQEQMVPQHRTGSPFWHLKQWCNNNGMNNRAFQNFLRVFLSVERNLLSSREPKAAWYAKYSKATEVPLESYSLVGDFICDRFAEAFAENKLQLRINKRSPFYVDEAQTRHQLSDRDIFTKEVTTPETIIFARVIEIFTNRSRHIVSIYIPANRGESKFLPTQNIRQIAPADPIPEEGKRITFPIEALEKSLQMIEEKIPPRPVALPLVEIKKDEKGNIREVPAPEGPTPEVPEPEPERKRREITPREPSARERRERERREREEREEKEREEKERKSRPERPSARERKRVTPQERRRGSVGPSRQPERSERRSVSVAPRTRGATRREREEPEEEEEEEEILPRRPSRRVTPRERPSARERREITPRSRSSVRRGRKESEEEEEIPPRSRSSARRGRKEPEEEEPEEIPRRSSRSSARRGRKGSKEEPEEPEEIPRRRSSRSST
jgi:hypothetical protein